MPSLSNNCMVLASVVLATVCQGSPLRIPFEIIFPSNMTGIHNNATRTPIATPTPTNIRKVFPAWPTIPVPSPEEMCKINFKTPKDTWEITGAGRFLDNVIAAKGALHWPTSMEQNPGGASNSDLNCADLRSGHCPPPELECPEYNPPEIFHIRRAMSICWRVLRTYQEELQDSMIEQILGSGALIADFGPSLSGTNINGLVGGGLTIASAIFGHNPFLGTLIGITSGVMEIVTSVEEGQPIDVQAGLNERLSVAFEQTREAIALTARTIFGAESDTSILSTLLAGQSDGEAYQTDIGKFFSGGRFLINTPGTLDSDIKGILEKAELKIKQALVIQAMKEQGYFLFVDKGTTTFDQCNFPGSRFMNGLCYRMVKSYTRGPEKLMDDLSGNLYSKFGGYSIDDQTLKDIYKNIEDCKNSVGARSVDLIAGHLSSACFYEMDAKIGFKCTIDDGTEAGRIEITEIKDSC